MHVACLHSEQWLRQTIRAWLRPAIRHVSTSSAINRGLRATKSVRDGDGRGGRQRRRLDFNQRPDGPRESSPAPSKSGRQHAPGPSENRRGKGLSDRWMPANGRAKVAATTALPTAQPMRSEDEHASTIHLLGVRLGSVRNMDAVLQGGTDFKRRAKIADLRERLAEVNRSSHLLARATSHFSAAPPDRHAPDHPLVVHGDTPPAVRRTALWLSPNSSLGLVFPKPTFPLALRKPTKTTTKQPKVADPERATRPNPPGTQQEEGVDNIPLSMPYTTAASTFLYGSNTVLAALRAQRRKLYHLYLHPRLSARDANAKDIKALAKQLHVRTTEDADLRLLDKMSDDRPHNGVVLEASRLPTPPVLSLAEPQLRTSVVPLVLDRQSAEDVAVNGAPGGIPTLTKTWRHPFVLMLDGITDEGNLGNILRTAHFYGVDAVAIATNTCAPLNSAILAKASSGACEALRILALPRPNPFVYDCSKAGWHVYAAVAPPSQRPAALRRPTDHERNVTTSALAQSSPLAKHPAILMLGAEGEGLREGLRKRADHFVTIEQGERAFHSEDELDVGVDSLNVGVAAGVLVEAFTRKPQGAQDLSITGELGF